MSNPTTFAVVRCDGAPDGYLLGSYECEAVELPRLGPTSWALLRLLDRIDVHTRYPVAAVAQQLGTSPSRLWTSVLRLEHFGLVKRLDDGGDTFVLARRLPRLTIKEWRRLPEVVRAAHGDLAPTPLLGPPRAVQWAG